MATEQVSLMPHELVALLVSKMNMCASHLSGASPDKIQFDNLATEYARMHQLTLELREKCAALMAAEANTEEQRAS